MALNKPRMGPTPRQLLAVRAALSCAHVKPYSVPALLRSSATNTVCACAQGFVESGSETAKSLLSAVGGVVAKAAEKLSHAMLNMGDTVNVEVPPHTTT